MEFEVYIVDAFSNQQFKGNSAAVVPVSEWPDDSLMQQIAIENNLSETAFIKATADNRYFIRWFSPITEIDFCGHATLAASFVLFNQLNCVGTLIFTTNKVGELCVNQLEDGRIEMSFPNLMPVEVSEPPCALLKGLSIAPRQVLKNQQAYVVVLADQAEVASVKYFRELLITLAPLDVVVTARANDYDFVSRYFWPANGGDEDPVTGSIHAALAPYWAKHLGKSSLTAYQASKRGGVLYCQLKNDRVLVSGNAVIYLKGQIFVQ